jgi:hypothetical protein
MRAYQFSLNPRRNEKLRQLAGTIPILDTIAGVALYKQKTDGA